MGLELADGKLLACEDEAFSSLLGAELVVTTFDSVVEATVLGLEAILDTAPATVVVSLDAIFGFDELEVCSCELTAEASLLAEETISLLWEVRSIELAEAVDTSLSKISLSGNEAGEDEEILLPAQPDKTNANKMTIDRTFIKTLRSSLPFYYIY